MISALSYENSADILEFDNFEMYGDVYKKAIEYSFLQKYDGLFIDCIEKEIPLPLELLRLDFDSDVILDFCEVLMNYYFTPCYWSSVFFNQ
ncbi:hypothetical protein LU293_00025 [Moraxella nasovis]|uniref:hypothetical protein n=1 Tax=Moraxella nasovis TaxID=2904121 RepID=UPI001F6214CB|nr:hypothetical protein [Moraxella nasovis]UNU73340.1 hypothetical protein LU293_00025 [Moraxella nasovis]